MWLKLSLICALIGPPCLNLMPKKLSILVAKPDATMASPSDLAVRSALSTICTRCSSSLLRGGRRPNGILRTLSQQQSFYSQTSPRLVQFESFPRRNTPLRQVSPPRRLSSTLVQKLFGSGKEASQGSNPVSKRILAADDLFHSFTDSPIPEIRHRATFIRQHASCPHPDHHASGVPAHVDYECPDCGIPVYCSKEHWADDYEAHLQVCDTLRQINEDDHDLRSGRIFPEFEYAGPQVEEALINMTNWDTFLYTRSFQAINDDRSMRQATRLLTYPITVGSIIHELSPYAYKKGDRLTIEGLKSFSGMHTHQNSPVNANTVQLCGIRSIPQNQVVVKMSKVCASSRHP